MAHFRGTVRDGRGEVSRLGHAKTGLVTYACGYNGKVRVSLRNDKTSGVDTAYVTLETNNGTFPIYDGPLNEFKPKTEWTEIPWKPKPLTSEVTK